MALREADSPANISSAPGDGEVLAKKRWSEVLLFLFEEEEDGMAILREEAKPEPPETEETRVWEARLAGRGRRAESEGSSFILRNLSPVSWKRTF